MSLWIFQSIVNLLLINAALFWLLSRKQTKFLEAQVDRLEHEIEALKSRSKNSAESQISSDGSSSSAKISSSVNPAWSANSSSSSSSSSSANISPSVNIASPANAISPAQEFAIAKDQRSISASGPIKESSASNMTYSHPLRSAQSASAASIPAGASSLVEKQNASSNTKNGSKEAFEKASVMLSSGVNVKEISRVTGLSLAELQLMNKFATRVQ